MGAAPPSPAPPAPPSPAPQCPRCGYDLSGLVASWKDRCPLGATCAECGLQFDCGNVLSPKALGPPWSFEHARTEKLRRWVATSRVSLHPWRLTRELSIDHQISVRRLVIFALTWLGGLYVALGVLRAAAFDPGPSFVGAIPWDVSDWEFWAPRLGAALWPYGWTEFQVGPRTWAELPLFVVLILAYAPALLMPLWMMVLGTTFREASVRRVHLFRGLAYTIPGAALTLHTLIAAMIGSFFVASWTPGGEPMPQALFLGLTIAYYAWLTAWWWLFIARYLRLRHAPAVALVMMVVTALSVVTLLVLLAMDDPRL